MGREHKTLRKEACELPSIKTWREDIEKALRWGHSRNSWYQTSHLCCSVGRNRYARGYRPTVRAQLQKESATEGLLWDQEPTARLERTHCMLVWDLYRILWWISSDHKAERSWQTFQIQKQSQNLNKRISNRSKRTWASRCSTATATGNCKLSANNRAETCTTKSWTTKNLRDIFKMKRMILWWIKMCSMINSGRVSSRTSNNIRATTWLRTTLRNMRTTSPIGTNQSRHLSIVQLLNLQILTIPTNSISKIIGRLRQLLRILIYSHGFWLQKWEESIAWTSRILSWETKLRS